ncbi:hypothetical protein [Sinorhizobium sp. RAC02]
MREVSGKAGLTIAIVRDLGQLDVPDGKGGFS